ncbi:MAG: 50S ribosomal protein L9 [Candidatus Kaiserbacteria bacterium]|nr:50S ribosomal protein L9 [Candidatus Kaiserbacteria bacterium]
MEVVLLEDIKGLGMRGDVCTVKDGYAMNFLIPQKKVSECSGTEAAQAMQQRASTADRQEQEKDRVASVIPSLPETVTIQMAANEEGTLFSSVTGETVAEKLRSDGFAVDDAWFSFDPIKESGSHEITVQKGEVEKQMTIQIEVQ